MSVDAQTPVRTDPLPQPAAPVAARTTSFAVPWLDVLLLFTLFVMAIVPRAAWIAYNDRPPKGLNDPSLYVLHGDGIADGGGYVRLTGEKTAYYPVGYPAVLGGLKKAGDIFGWGRSTFSAKMMNGMFGAITVLLVYLLGMRLFDRRVGFTAGAILAFFPSQIYYTGVTLSEPLFTLLLVASLVVLLWDRWDQRGIPWWRLAVCGIILGAATMTRAITLAFPLVLLAIWWFCLQSKRRALLQTLIVIAGVLVLTVPWSIRNTLAFGQLTGTSTNLGDDLCIGNFDDATGKFLLRGKCFEGYDNLPPKEAEVTRNRDGVQTAFDDLKANPGDIPRLIGNKAYWLFYKDDDGIFAAEMYGEDFFMWHPMREILAFAGDSVYYAIGMIAIAGAAAFALSKDIRRAVLLFAALYVFALPLVFFGDPRFHFPGMPLVIIIAAATLVGLWDRQHRALLELRS